MVCCVYVTNVTKEKMVTLYLCTKFQTFMESNTKKSFLNDWSLVIIACLTLGLAPFFPEPHIIGKVRWILGGAKGMQLMDYLDFAMHGLPFVLLIRLAIITFIRKNKVVENE